MHFIILSFEPKSIINKFLQEYLIHQYFDYFVEKTFTIPKMKNHEIIFYYFEILASFILIIISFQLTQFQSVNMNFN